MYLANNLLSVKTKWGYKQDKMGIILGVTKAQYGAYERGKNEPNVAFLVKLEERTGFPFRQFVTTMLKPEEIPAAPLTDSEFLEVSAGWGKQENIPSTPVEAKVERLEGLINELFAELRAKDLIK